MTKFLTKLAIFLTLGVMLLIFWSYFWGFWGKMDKKHFDLILTCTFPWQKKELADALNFYYTNNLLARNTVGKVLTCEPNAESIKEQFNWFHRNTVSALMTDMPDYHEVVKEAVFTEMDDVVLPDDPSTFELEMMLERYYLLGGEQYLTDKDKIGLGITAVSLILRITITAFNPFAGAAITAVSLVQANLSDSAKAVPGIITFMKIRSRNFSYCFLLTWGLCTFLFMPYGKGKKEGKPKSGKKG